MPKENALAFPYQQLNWTLLKTTVPGFQVGLTTIDHEKSGDILYLQPAPRPRGAVINASNGHPMRFVASSPSPNSIVVSWPRAG